ncbi:MAG TPA: amidophosphoribosyltransferase [Candidatus Kapabacteria bacterium]|nr:amidophosphoribosyltransferase [Candidatus Kapabacteria bacterium]
MKFHLNDKNVMLSSPDTDKARPNCAVVGVYGHPEAAVYVFYALHSLQHRGQEASGITSVYFDEKKNKKKYAYHKGEGLVMDVFNKGNILTDVLKGDMAIGHNRYSTTGSSSSLNIQPFNMIYNKGLLTLAHNGNLTNTKTLRNQLINEGSIFQTTTDSELFLHLVAKSKEEKVIDKILYALRTARGAYSLTMLTDNEMYAARDPHGVRPLNIGRIKVNGKYAYIAASESAAFDIISAEYIRSVHHNELVVIDRNTIETGEIKSYKIQEQTPEAKHCIFEYVYFARPDSKIFGHSVDKVRRKLGKLLAEESPVIDDDKIRAIPVPDSANTATIGFARMNNQLNSPTVFELGLIRSHYVGRTFISPGQSSRELKVKTKFNTVKGVIQNRIVVLIDDSIVRGTTSKSLVKLVRDAGPAKIHMRITSPPVKYPCYYGMDFPSAEELIANHYTTEDEIGKAIGVDSLKYLSPESLLAAVPKDEGIGYCTACFTGKYPIPIEDSSLNANTND